MTAEKVFPSHFPPSCPYEGAIEQTMTVYRWTNKPNPAPKDFKSYYDLYKDRPEKHTGDMCLACGLSVYTNLEDMRPQDDKQERTGVMRRRKREKSMMILDITPDSGRVKSTSNRDSHHTWWIYDGYDPMRNVRS